MKTLVLYASKYGCAEDCAKRLKSRLNHESATTNLKDAKAIYLQQYDWIIIGGSIYVGKIQKEIKLFCEKKFARITYQKYWIISMLYNSGRRK